MSLSLSIGQRKRNCKLVEAKQCVLLASQGCSVPSARTKLSQNLLTRSLRGFRSRGVCRRDHQSPESLGSLAAVHGGEHRSDHDECEDAERSEEVTFEERALQARDASKRRQQAGEGRGQGQRSSLNSWMAYTQATEELDTEVSICNVSLSEELS